jgi:CelD/BcsL family acetyltransferase involved in cellulose biosynthesis
MEVVVERGSLEPLMDDWAELHAADDRATPFQSPGWARAWDRHWSRTAEPWVLVVRDGDQVAGLLPLWRQRVAGLRLLRSSGDPADYSDLLALPHARERVQAAAARELWRRRHEWDVLVLGELPPDSAIPVALNRVGLKVAHRSTVACPLLALPDSFEAYLKTIPSRRRTNVRRHLRYLDEGEIELRVPPVEDLPAAIDRWQELRVRQWQTMRKHLLSAHGTRDFRNLVVDAVTDLVPKRLMLVWEFVRGGQVVGSSVNLCDDRAFYPYLNAFAPELHSFGIGKIATAHGIRVSIAAGRAYYDFMRGTEPYKYWFGAVDRLSPSLVFASGSARSVVAGRYGALRRPLTLIGGRVRAVQDELPLLGRA